MEYCSKSMMLNFCNIIASCLQFITHGSVSCGPRKWDAHPLCEYIIILTRTTKSRFSCICSSMMPYMNGTYFTVEVASTQGRSPFKLEKNLPKHNMSKQTFKIFLHFFFFFRGLQGSGGLDYSFLTLFKNCYI